MKKLVALICLVPALFCADASALDSLGRDQGWTLGLGFGMGRANVDYNGGDIPERMREGVNTEFRMGKMLNRHLALTFDYQGWLLEGGNLNSYSARFRQGLQMWGMGATWYPGNPQNAWGGLVLRASTGPALGNFAVTTLDSTLIEVEEARLDEWGWGLGISAGYEFFITHTFAVAGMANYGYMWIEEQLINTGQWATVTLLGSWYF